MKDPTGRITIPGFYDDVEPVTTEERRASARLPLNEKELCESIGVYQLSGEEGYSVLERRSLRPTLDVHGLWSGYQGEGRKTIIPAVAHAKLSARLVTDQCPDRVYELIAAYVRERAEGMEVEVRSLGGTRATKLSVHHPLVQAANRAMERVFGVKPLLKWGSGSIAACSAIADTLGLPLLMYGFTQPDDNEHAPNEWLDANNYADGARAIVALWQELASGTSNIGAI
jgi:acetylornithine deacetylase/succinyl-diaminopimelate desuccinylase-like protein